jgi:flagellar biosynthesis/type III secretory pathway chaperone
MTVSNNVDQYSSSAALTDVVSTTSNATATADITYSNLKELHQKKRRLFLTVTENEREQEMRERHKNLFLGGAISAYISAKTQPYDQI